MNEVAVGEIKIKATKARDKNGKEGYFLSTEDWGTVKKVILTRGAKVTTKKSLLPGMKEAVEEIRQHLLGVKRLPNASEPIQGV